MISRLNVLQFLALLPATTVISQNVVHFAPASTNLNNLSFVLNGTGAPGIFNSSVTPNDEYGIYNWCNMPHVRVREYITPSESEFTLKYIEVIQRHQKRTPYNTNTFFKENIEWDCPGDGPVYYGIGPVGVAQNPTVVQWNAYTDQSNPFTDSVGPGFVGSNCAFPQITTAGIIDSHTHGSDLRAVYASRLGLSTTLDPSTFQIRVTNNQITSQVSGGLLHGLFPDTDNADALIQSETYDSLEPAYSCPNANQLFTQYTTDSSNWTLHLMDAQPLYDKLDAVSGIPLNDTAGWHTSFDHYYDNMSAKQCHSKTLPCSVNDSSICVTQEEANTVYRLGNYEYSYYYRDAPESTLYSSLHYGAWVLELVGHLQEQLQGTSKVKYFHNVAHDGSMAPLLGILQISEMVWPGMGSELVFELYQQKSTSAFFLRVLWGGQPIHTSLPLGANNSGVLDMIPVGDFFDYVNATIGTGSELFNNCNN
ncbi:histidine phosphatase [Rhodocollybia butyracea]|uniref:Histidine phosphatase n=1 Tax=Rhodocollybia butyracea TaxID=206335 RepID=A0A9P5PFF8_9AGAR|nr:histidine phosphatase [Rhodocollybia butyracea]